MSTPTTDLTEPTDDPIAEIHEIRRRLAAEHGNDPHQFGEFLRGNASRTRNKSAAEKMNPVPEHAG